MEHAKTKNTKKRVAAIALTLALVALVAGSTLAYFNASGKADNVITTKGVTVSLNEYMVDPSTGELVKYQDPEKGIMPGDVVSKIPMAEMAEQSAPAWVRMRVDTTITSAGGDKLDELPISFDFDRENWTYKQDDGWWYYDIALNPGEKTIPLFQNVTFSKDAGNEYQRSTVKITINAQAVQSANNGATALEAAGWPSGN